MSVNKLGQEIHRYTKRGYRVVNRTDTTAQLVREKRLSCLWTILTGGFYLLWYWSRKDRLIYLELLPNGKVQTTRAKG